MQAVQYAPADEASRQHDGESMHRPLRRVVVDEASGQQGGRERAEGADADDRPHEGGQQRADGQDQDHLDRFVQFRRQAAEVEDAQEAADRAAARCRWKRSAVDGP